MLEERTNKRLSNRSVYLFLRIERGNLPPPASPSQFHPFCRMERDLLASLFSGYDVKKQWFGPRNVGSVFAYAELRWISFEPVVQSEDYPLRYFNKLFFW